MFFRFAFSALLVDHRTKSSTVGDAFSLKFFPPPSEVDRPVVFAFDGEVTQDTVTDTVYVPSVIAPSGTGTFSVIAVASEVADDFSFKLAPFNFLWVSHCVALERIYVDRKHRYLVVACMRLSIARIQGRDRSPVPPTMGVVTAAKEITVGSNKVILTTMWTYISLPLNVFWLVVAYAENAAH